MRIALKWVARALALLLVVAVALGIWKRAEITRLMAVNALFEADRIVGNFSHMDRLFFHTTIARGAGPVSPLPTGPAIVLPQDAQDWIAARSVTAIVILKDGAILHESYHLGTAPEDRRISWSVAKSFLSALTGVLLEEGTLPSLDIPVVEAVPGLTGSAYDGARLIDVLHMASGAGFDEDYLDFNSDINRMGRVLALGGSMDAFAASLTARDSVPGQRMAYVSIDTHVIGMVLRAVTGRDIPDLLTEKIIGPLGLESAPIMLTDGDGVSFVLGGLNLTTRDYARFGQMMAQGGIWQGQRIVPEPWVMRSTTPSAPTGPTQPGYGLQWWIPQGYGPGEFLAQGIYGQFIYVNRMLNVVIAVNSADRGFEEPGVEAANHAMLQRIARAL